MYLVSTLLCLTACNQKELCFDHDAHTLKRIVNFAASYEREWQYTYEGGTDWQGEWPADFPVAYDDLRPAMPEGLRIQDYPPAGGVSTFNLDPEGGTVSFSDGMHSLLFYNNGTHYIVFDDLTSYATARATTRARTRSTYSGSPYSRSTDEVTVNAPDMLYGHYMAEFTPEASTEPQQYPVTLHPLVFTYYVRYEFARGAENAALARGALAGMAKEVYLNNGRTSEEPVTVLFDCDLLEGFGAVAAVQTFGIPNFPNEHYSRATAAYGLNLEVKLRDGTTVQFDFDVTEQVAAQPRGGVITVTGIEIPDVGATGGGFYVTVTDWGEDQDVVLPL